MNPAIFDDINWIAVFCAAVAFFMLGALWYSKLLFVKKWLEYLKIDPKHPDSGTGMGLLMLGSFLLMFCISVLIAILRSKLDISGSLGGIKLGVTTGFFCAAAISITYLYEKKPSGLHLINGGYTILGNILAALIICNWN